jgi:hypothetical protein
MISKQTRRDQKRRREDGHDVGVGVVDVWVVEVLE